MATLPAGAEAATDPRYSSRPYEHLFESPAPSRALDPRAAGALTAALRQEAPPKVEHTGWRSLFRATGSDVNAWPRRRSTWVILGIGAASAALAHPIDDDVNGRLAGKGAGRFFAVGQYVGLGWVQAGVAVGTYAVGRYVIHPPEGQTNRWSHMGFDLLRANILAQSFTYGIKYAVRRDRPSGECCAFPSGHASVTFASAAVIERHFGYRNAWPMFVIAGYVAASRLHENKHYLSDVLFGSALGMTTGWTVVGRHGREQYALAPVPVKGGMGVAVIWTPGGARAH
jgi:membrane-associated phospholipid phosphatase